MGHALRKPNCSKPVAASTQNDDSTDGSSKPRPKEQKADRAPDTITCSEGDQPPAIIPDRSTDMKTQDSKILTTVDDRVKGILRATWSNDFGVLYELGTDIYSEIFRLDPGVKKLFRDLDGYDLENDPMALRQCAAFRKQALRFIQTVSMTVQNSSHLLTIDEYLRDIGRRHVQYKHRGFEPGHWRVFETAMCNVMEARASKAAALSEDDRLLLAKTYRQLSGHIVALMTIGFRQGEQEQKS